MRRPLRLYINTSLRWNSIWSHSHELTNVLSRHFPIIYYEPPALTSSRSAVLHDKNSFARPANVRYLSSSKRFGSLGIGYMLHYQRHTLAEFKSHRDDFDVLLTYNVYELLNLWRAKKWGKKVVFVYADEYDELTTLPLLKPFLRFSLRQFLKKADLIVCTAKVMERKARRYNKNVVYLPNAVNLNDKKYATTSISHKGFALGFLGAIEPWVDWELIASAARNLENEKNISFEIIGDGTELAPFKQATSGLSNIRFQGYVPHSEVYKHIAAWDAAIIPFKINTVTNSVSPIKLFEYWLLKKPVMATRTEELKQYTKELLLVSTSEDIVRNIHKLREQRTLRTRLGVRGNAVVKRYNWQAYEKTYTKLLEKL